MKKFLIVFVAIILIVAILAGGVFYFGNRYIENQKSDDIPDTAEVEKNDFGTITAVGRGLYDQDGNRFEIKGINYGNLFVAEGWMTVNSLGAAYNDDGSFKSVNKEGVVEDVLAVVAGFVFIGQVPGAVLLGSGHAEGGSVVVLLFNVGEEGAFPLGGCGGLAMLGLIVGGVVTVCAGGEGENGQCG